jgi:hypothetical protein
VKKVNLKSVNSKKYLRRRSKKILDQIFENIPVVYGKVGIKILTL